MILVNDDSQIKNFNASFLSKLREYNIDITIAEIEDLDFYFNENKDKILDITCTMCQSNNDSGDYIRELLDCEIDFSKPLPSCSSMCNSGQNIYCSECYSTCYTSNSCISCDVVCVDTDNVCISDDDTDNPIMGCVSCDGGCNSCDSECYSCFEACQGALTCTSCNNGNGVCESNCFGDYDKGCKNCISDNTYVCATGNGTCISCDNENTCSSCNLTDSTCYERDKVEVDFTEPTSCTSKDGFCLTFYNNGVCLEGFSINTCAKEYSFDAGGYKEACPSGFSKGATYSCVSDFKQESNSGNIDCSTNFSVKSNSTTCTSFFSSEDGDYNTSCSSNYSTKDTGEYPSITCKANYTNTTGEYCSSGYSVVGNDNSYTKYCNSGYGSIDNKCSSGYSIHYDDDVSSLQTSCATDFSNPYTSCYSEFGGSQDAGSSSEATCVYFFHLTDGSFTCESNYNNTTEKESLCTSCVNVQYVECGNTAEASCSVCVGGDATCVSGQGCEGCQTGVECYSYSVTEDGSSACMYNYTSEEGVICVAYYDSSCTSDNGSNVCTSCNECESCDTGCQNCDTCQSCDSSCYGGDSTCSSCNSGCNSCQGGDKPSVCQSCNNSCNSVYMGECSASYINQCNTCYGACYAFCDSGYTA